MRKAILLIILLGSVGAAQNENQSKLEIYKHWNQCVESLRREGDFETGLWPRLRESLIEHPPEHVRSLDREQMIEELIKLHEQRLKLLKEMLKRERQ